MDEPKDPAPGQGRTRPLLPVAGQLTPVQQAYSDYATHFLTCVVCLNNQMPTCERAKTLWRAYEEQVETARRRMHETDGRLA